jgi:hypothetical protein
MVNTRLRTSHFRQAIGFLGILPAPRGCPPREAGGILREARKSVNDTCAAWPDCHDESERAGRSDIFSASFASLFCAFA